MDERQQIIFGAGCGSGFAPSSSGLRVCDGSRSTEHAMLRLNAVLADEQDSGLLQNDEFRARAQRDCKGACIGEHPACCCRAILVFD
jgi:hypothetical protein